MYSGDHSATLSILISREKIVPSFTDSQHRQMKIEMIYSTIFLVVIDIGLDKLLFF